MNRPNHQHKSSIHIIIYSAIGVGFAIIFAVLFIHHKQAIKPEKEVSHRYTECDHIHNASAPIEPKDKLNDLNDLQIVHAQANGLKKPFTDSTDFKNRIAELEQQYTLIKVTENRFYQMKSLTHSLPYLIPEAVDMLNEIGYRFQKECQERKYKNFKYRITSLLRTEETQTKLSHRNGNATKSLSCHLYGTTVDISYKNFYNTKTDTLESSWEAIQAMTKVLVEMRKECKLLAVRERHQSCFHITVVCCKPEPKKEEE